VLATVPADDSPVMLAPETEPPAPRPALNATNAVPPTRPGAAQNVRRHTIVKGDTLFSLAQRYYGNRSKWRDILAANRDVLPSAEAPLRIGMELKIP
jgi:nucleoid-associated protein YgaU